jgi:trimeric autotransporter adhesin
MFIKKLNKVASVLSTAVLLASLAAPLVANAASIVGVTGVQAVNTSATSTDYKNLGEIKLEVPVANLNDNHFFFLRLPSDFKINIPAAASSSTDIAGATITKPDGSMEPLIQTDGGSDPWTDGVAHHIAVYQTNADELKVIVKHAAKAATAGNDANTLLKINLANVYVPVTADNNIQAIIEAQPGSAFTNDIVTIANKGTGTVSVCIDSIKTIPQSAGGTIDTIRFKEDSPASLSAGTSLKLKLPNGFEWTNSTYTLSFVYGDSSAVGQITATRAADKGELDVNIPVATNSASYFTISNAAIDVYDTTVAKYGDITLVISGANKTNVNALAIARYADYSTAVSTENPKNVMAGRSGIQDAENTEMGQLVIHENAPGSMRAGGTIRVQLTGGAKWAVDKNGNGTSAGVICRYSLSYW